MLAWASDAPEADLVPTPHARATPPLASPILVGVDFGAAFWVQRTNWPTLRDAALAAEQAGFEGFLPVFPPQENPEQVLDWLRRDVTPPASRPTNRPA